MPLNPAILFGAVGAGLLLAFAASDDAKAAEEQRERDKPKPAPRPGQPTPGAGASIPGVPSIPAPPNAGSEPGIPPGIVGRMVTAIASGSAAEMRRVASALEREGFPVQASELRSAADALEASIRAAVPPTAPVPAPTPVVRPPPGAVQIPPPSSVVRPPDAPPKFFPEPKPVVAPPPPVFTTQPIVVPRPPPGAVPIPAPPHPVGAIPDKGTLAGKAALMLWESAPGPVRDPALLTAYKQSVGLRDPGNLYGPGTAKSLMGRGIVPPTPWDWPSKKSAAAKDLRDNYLFKARQDSARREEWEQAAADVGRFV